MIKIIDIVEFIGKECDVVGSDSLLITSVDPIDDSREDSLCFCSAKGQKGITLINSSASLTILCLLEEKEEILNSLSDRNKTLIFVKNPRLEYSRVLAEFFSPKPSAKIHRTVDMAPESVLGKDVTIGANTIIGENCFIGDKSYISSNVTIYSNTSIGSNAIIHSGAVIGADGFGFEKDDNTGKWVKFPQIGGVEIGNDVEIGANTCIDRGALTNTRIGNGTKIDNLSHIAHNVEIGDNCIIVANVFLGGQVTIGEGSWIGPEASIREGLTIGNNVLVGMGAVVTKNVESGVVVAGNPARILRPND